MEEGEKCFNHAVSLNIEKQINEICSDWILREVERKILKLERIRDKFSPQLFSLFSMLNCFNSTRLKTFPASLDLNYRVDLFDEIFKLAAIKLIQISLCLSNLHKILSF